MSKDVGPTPAPSSNWAKLKSTLAKATTKSKLHAGSQDTQTPKKRKGLHGISNYARTASHNTDHDTPSSSAGPSRIAVPVPANVKEDVILLPFPSADRKINDLREMVTGRPVLSEGQKAPRTYIAVDCEMVGLGHLGSESALARVSLINYHGHVLLDTFVAPRERVTEYRTWVSGIREKDLVGAPGFEEVQKQVAELCEGRVLVGHAIDNDLRALLLTHPGPMVRDTQKCQALREISKTKYPGLAKLCLMELGVEIQKGSHSSVTDARATMALYRLHKVAWEQQLRPVTEKHRAKLAESGKSKRSSSLDTGSETIKGSGKKRKRHDEAEEEEREEGGDMASAGARAARNEVSKTRRESSGPEGRKGISSGLSVVVRRNGERLEPKRRGGGVPSAESGGTKWWEQAAA